jgi:hypothetical protein
MQIPFGKIKISKKLPIVQLGNINTEETIERFFGQQLIDDNTDRLVKPEGSEDQGHCGEK